MNKYLEFFCIAIRHEQRHRSIILGRSAFYIVLLLIYSSLWRAAEHSGLRVEYSAAEMLWYLATTEWIVLSTPSIYLDIEGDFRNGSLVYQLARPVSYLGSRLAENLGTAVVRMAYLAVVGLSLIHI